MMLGNVGKLFEIVEYTVKCFGFAQFEAYIKIKWYENIAMKIKYVKVHK